MSKNHLNQNELLYENRRPGIPPTDRNDADPKMWQKQNVQESLPFAFVSTALTGDTGKIQGKPVQGTGGLHEMSWSWTAE